MYQDPDPAHERANNRIVLEPGTWVVTAHERYDDKPAGQKIMASIFPLHSGAFFGLPGLVLFMVASLAMPLFAITGWMLYLDRRRKKRAAREAAAALAPVASAKGEVLVAFASQTGTAERLAWQTAATAGVTITYAWNPLAVVEFGLSGHNDVLLLTGLLAALWLHLTGHWRAAIVAIALASLVKVVALVFLPGYLCLLVWEGDGDRRQKLLRAASRTIQAAALILQGWLDAQRRAK
jgi:hypothetical protein